MAGHVDAVPRLLAKFSAPRPLPRIELDLDPEADAATRLMSAAEQIARLRNDPTASRERRGLPFANGCAGIDTRRDPLHEVLDRERRRERGAREWPPE